MDMELISLLRILWRWRFMTLSILLVTGLAVGFHVHLARPSYEATVRLQVTTPEQEDIDLYDQYAFISDRDEVTVARNNLAEVLQSQVVRERTVNELALSSVDGVYQVNVYPVRDADFIDVTIEAGDSNLAAEIATAHVRNAIQLTGELRALPADTLRERLTEQLQVAQEELRATESAFAEFQRENNITTLEYEIGVREQILQHLQLERNQRLFEEVTVTTSSTSAIDTLINERRSELSRLVSLQPVYALLIERVQETGDAYQRLLEEYNRAEQNDVLAESLGIAEEEFRLAEDELAAFRAENHVASLDEEIATYQNVIGQLQLERARLLLRASENPADLVAPIDASIDEYREELEQLVSLWPTYNLMTADAEQARQKYELILDKYTEAQLKGDTIRATGFIQVVAPAIPPAEPVSNTLKLMVLAISGSVGLSVLLAFLLEYVSSFRSENLAVADKPQQKSSAAVADAGTEVSPSRLSPEAKAS